MEPEGSLVCAQGCTLRSSSLKKISKSKSEQLQVCKIWGFHGDEDSNSGVLGYDTTQWCGRIPMFQRTMLPPSSGWKAAWLSEMLVSYHITTWWNNAEHDLNLQVWSSYNQQLLTKKRNNYSSPCNAKGSHKLHT